ncbi:MAG: acyl transferase [Bacteroidetes bacterium]|nr:acyl transferase [Bacteroidota bacterium]MDA1119354.1 acyl transferase [Bacteroidota bacterium]
MQSINSIEKRIPKINDKNFKNYALDVFKYQAKSNRVYKAYLTNLNVEIAGIKELDNVPFLPIEFYKSEIVKSDNWSEETVFYSSGTTGQQKSEHFIKNLSFYHRNTKHIFESFYGPLNNYMIVALLPSYENNSSLVSMVSNFIDQSGCSESSFISKDLSLLELKKERAVELGKTLLLIGVSHALLGLAEMGIDLRAAIIMETGGMKGERTEITRKALHKSLCDGFNSKEIHSEYGMSELMSQAYSLGEGEFKAPNCMKVMIRDSYDPFSYIKSGKTGGINIIDLANIHTCSFLETKDLGRETDNGFEVLGRFDNSEVRGCNLMVL